MSTRKVLGIPEMGRQSADRGPDRFWGSLFCRLLNEVSFQIEIVVGKIAISLMN